MPIHYQIILYYLLAINLFAIIITCSDKRRAIKHKWRIKEQTLLIVSALGGSVAMYLTMKKIRHKTTVKKFMIGIPAIFFAEVAIIIALLILL